MPDEYASLPLYDYGDALIFPGMVDLHIHAPQYAFRGMCMDLELMDWLNRYTFPEVVVTNRGVRCPEGDFALKLKYACIMGAGYDAELYVCRRPIYENEKYVEHVLDDQIRSLNTIVY